MDKILEDLKIIVKEILDKQLTVYKNNCPPNITDLVFREIENNPNYKKIYDFARKNRSIYAVNPTIGKTIRVHWKLQNLDECIKPNIHLINSYTKHSN